MQYTFVSGSPGRNPRLILIFAGWGMDATPFESLVRPGYDIVVLWDYRDTSFPDNIVRGYREIVLLAWSMGVLVAMTVIPGLKDRITLKLAVNGTPYPVDNEYGIPEAVFSGTLEGLCERTVEKFRMRMCGGSKAYADFRSCEPLRSVEELKAELTALRDLALRRPECTDQWDHAVIGNGDAIFPPNNQLAAWTTHARSISLYSGPHLPCFQDLLDHFVISKDTVERRFERSKASYPENAMVQREIVEELFELVKKHAGGLKHPDALELGCGTGMLSTMLVSFTENAKGTLELWDIVDSSPLPGATFRCVDAETAIRETAESTYDLIVSASTIQWFNSPVGFLHEAMRSLRPGGVLAVSTFVKGNLVEVAQATGIFLPLMSEEEWKKTATELGDVLDLYTRSKTLYFENPVKVFRHLKDTGVNALSPKERVTLSIERYPREADGKCRLTYMPVFMIIRKQK
ncbi:MAG: DUF452 family protein [Muribaculaceae bacterium]|nr:DUF452 family protein [Muribaculaceae bacterium]